MQLANQVLTEVRQHLSQQVRGRRGRAVDPAWTHRMLLLRAGATLSDKAAPGSTVSSSWTIRPAGSRPPGR
ncbi:hypothetical protein ACQCSX_18875 [Pseudarthrobacter sp. P1]|uniref:hypothetical protein n=1 Tax=Pseudarthrobacter sp. P1 TaxID=3418418 RepID=UPI003CE8B64C